MIQEILEWMTVRFPAIQKPLKACVTETQDEVDLYVSGYFVDSNGEAYVGEIEGGEFNGRGRLYWPDGHVSDGMWLNGSLYKGRVYDPYGYIMEEF